MSGPMPVESWSYAANGPVYRRLERILRNLDEPLVIVLEGGHFDPEVGASAFATHSLEAALELGERLVRSYQRNVRIVLGVLVDDLGQSSDAERRDAAIELPEELETILDEHWLAKRDRVLVMTERNARNRGVAHLKKLIGDGSSEGTLVLQDNDEGSSVCLEGEGGEHVNLANRRDKSWSAQCALIMGQHYTDVFQAIARRFSSDHPVAMVDYSEIADRQKVRRGTEVALRLFDTEAHRNANHHVVNVFFGTDDGAVHVVDYQASEDYA